MRYINYLLTYFIHRLTDMPDMLYLRVIEELKDFAHRDRAPEQEEDESTEAEEVRRRNPQNKLQREGVQLGYQELQPKTLHTYIRVYIYIYLFIHQINDSQ